MNDISDLMLRVDEINRKDPPYTDDDITVIIAYHRRARALRSAGVKPERNKLDLSAILGVAAPKETSTPIYTRRRL